MLVAIDLSPSTLVESLLSGDGDRHGRKELTIAQHMGHMGF